MGRDPAERGSCSFLSFETQISGVSIRSLPPLGSRVSSYVLPEERMTLGHYGHNSFVRVVLGLVEKI